MPPNEQYLPARHVSCRLVFRIEDSAVLALQVAGAAPLVDVRRERLEVLLDDRRHVTPTEEVVADHGGRIHVVRVPAGVVGIRYDAPVAPAVVELPPTDPPGSPIRGDRDAILALRQSRYCPSDELIGFAAHEFRDLSRGPDLGAEIASWVFERLAYEPGSSGPFDTAVDTLIANAGVCRDFAHLTISLCRSLGVPARLVSVYAPGLSPMDFHAVVEIRTAGAWEVLDPTRLAPRGSLLRIATGRDAADTAFATTIQGDAELLLCEVSAVVDGDLPGDDHLERIALP